MAQSDFHSQKYRDLLHLRYTPSSLITRSMRGVDVAVTETRDDDPTHGLCGEFTREGAYIVSLKLRDYPDCEYWERGKCVAKPNIRAGTTYLYDMKYNPRFVIEKPFHSLHFYVPASALDGVAEQAGARRVGQLECQFATGFRDEIVRHIGGSLMRALRRPSEANQLFVDHMMLALTAHVAQAYGGLHVSKPARGALAPWQLRRACEKLEANLAGTVSLQQIAAEFDLSVSYFSRAFRASTGLPPHQWLLRQRVKAAKQLMAIRELPLSEIAISAGFANQSHFTRVFSSAVGVSPGTWRREKLGSTDAEAWEAS
ncbi:helix-turn-helix domain-containing protein [Bradyrhizobium sp. CCBAU 11357]|uniref:helix-turn-helix domain-containing protein n=1 Tax=Bradyrhizobium sp. CCBAU 11357 TaxID=1630808 RepID=UPI0023045EBA|nr:AraC family transcriptional regulator [Bradyrhizobium sp. CCBAU 11357]MDA9499224.1 AraC family transcriptional regulator [Bradyrhizobium sp. CCBAU 11357]